MTWQDLAEEQLAAAQRLRRGKDIYPRAACSRAYYAAYSAIAGVASGSHLPTGRRNPHHAQLIAIVDATRLSSQTKAELKLCVARLRQRRVTADYVPSQAISKGDASAALQDAETVLRSLCGTV